MSQTENEALQAQVSRLETLLREICDRLRNEAAYVDTVDPFTLRDIAAEIEAKLKAEA